MRQHDTAQARPPIKCANPACNADITDPNRVGTYSIIMTLATRGPDNRLGAFQCPPIQELERGNYDAQHFCCSMECLRAILLECFDAHIVAPHNIDERLLAEHDAERIMSAYQAERSAQDVS